MAINIGSQQGKQIDDARIDILRILVRLKKFDDLLSKQIPEHIDMGEDSRKEREIFSQIELRQRLRSSVEELESLLQDIDADLDKVAYLYASLQQHARGVSEIYLEDGQ